MHHLLPIMQRYGSHQRLLYCVRTVVGNLLEHALSREDMQSRPCVRSISVAIAKAATSESAWATFGTAFVCNTDGQMHTPIALRLSL